MDTSDREPGPLPGTTDQGRRRESGPVRSYGWEWGRDEDRQPQLPWIGIFLVVLGGLLLLDRAAARSTSTSATCSCSPPAWRSCCCGCSARARSRCTPARS